MDNSKIVECILNIGLDVAIDKVKDKKDRIVVKERLREYIGRQNKINFHCSLEEEIDFGRLAEYIKTELLDDIKLRFWGTKKERGIARNNIRSKVAEYSKANTKLSYKRAMDITETALNILYGFYRNRTNRDLRFIATEIIEDTVSEINAKTDAQTEILSNKISEGEQKIISNISEIISDNSLMSLDANAKLLREGKISQVEANLVSGFNALGSIHDLHPAYRFEFDNKEGRFYSKPSDENAIKKYPPKIIATASINLEGEPIKEIDYKVVDYANRHQLPINIEILTAEKFLGDYKDPIQHEANDCIGEKYVIPPKPFPPAFPCTVSIDDDVIFEYILLRTQEVLDDGTIIISNREQENFALKFSMAIDQKGQRASFNLGVNSTINEDSLRFLQILKRAYAGGILSVKALETGTEFSKGNLDIVKYSGSFNSIDEEIEFLSNVIAIEKYFKQQILIPKQITNGDLEILNYLADLVNGKSYDLEWSTCQIPIIISDNFKSKISESNGTENNLTFIGTAHITLFDVTYTISVIRMFGKIKYENFSKLKQKAEILDVGDEIKITMLPAESKVGIIKDILNTEINVDELI